MKKKYDENSLAEDAALEDEAQKGSLKENVHALKLQNENLTHENEILKANLSDSFLEIEKMQILCVNANNIVHSKWWKATKPFRMATKLLRKIAGKIKRLFIKEKNKEACGVLSRKQRREQKNAVFEKNITFSILVPLYNTPKKFLVQMIRSVQRQTYPHWELCLADGSDPSHKNVETICKKYAQKEQKIRYKKLEENLGISENTNACIKMATGDYLALLDHDDLLHPSALYQNAKAIEEKGADFLYSDEAVFEKDTKHIQLWHYKPDFAIDYLRSNNYICHFTVFKKDLLKEVGAFRSPFNGSQDHDMVLRLTEKAKQIVHIPKILYYWRSHPGSVASDKETDGSAKPYAAQAGIKAIEEHLSRCGLKGTAESTKECPTIYRLRYELKETPLVSIIIASKDHAEDLHICLTSILEKSTYPQFEIIVVENNSTEPETFDYYRSLKENDAIQVVTYNGPFNYSAINNLGASYAKGKYLLFLNNDTEVINENWIEEMMMYAQRKDVGAVGAKLYYPDGTIQHGGIIVGLGEIAAHSHKNFPGDSVGYMGRLCMVQNYSAITGACLMISRSVFEQMNELDPLFETAYNDVDLCLRIRKAGYLIVWTPFATLYHHESKSRGLEDNPQKKKRLFREQSLFRKRWKKELKMGDPYYNPNLTLDKEDFSLK